MKSRHAVVMLVLSSAAALGQYQPYYYDTFSASIDTQKWHPNGAPSSGAGLYGTGSIISLISPTPPAPANDYEVKITLNLSSSVASNASYQTFLRAQTFNEAMGSGNSYIVEFTNLSVSTGMGTLNIWKMAGGALTPLAGNSAPWHNGTILRTVMTATNAILVYVDNVLYATAVDSTYSGGHPGVGMSNVTSANSIARVDLGPLDQTPPNTITAASVGSSSFPNHVDLQWKGVTDDANGSGLAYYQIKKNGTYLAVLYPTQTSFSDASVTPGVAYSYDLQAVDFHWNTSTVTISVTTPAANAIDPRQTGVRADGSYWGGAGENIDMRSGNLSFSLPLLKVNGRGWTLPFNLSYNGQNWRQDAGGNWNLGRDSGFGYGWKLQAGAVLPVYATYWILDHYLFIDSTGAEYRLDQNHGGIWTSKEGTYVEFDSATNRLFFPDGTFWALNCVSSGTEEDSGTEYPTLVQDANGNQVTILYQPSTSLTSNNTSSRMQTITDIMGTYNFAYTTPSGSFPHLTSITSSTYPAANYSFTYLPLSLVSPFTGASFSNEQSLHTITNTNSQLQQTLTVNNSGEMTDVQFPYGGRLGWAYTNMTYTTGNISRTLREVQNRYLTMSSGGTQLTYAISHDPGDSGRTFHYSTVLDDAGGQGEKAWFFQTDSAQPGFGLQTVYSERQRTPTLVEKRNTGSTWANERVLGRPYILSSYTTLDPGTPNQAQSRTDQAVDQYGNVTSLSQYDFGLPNAPSTASRVYSNTYLSDSSPTTVHPASSDYDNEHIHNRLLTTTVTNRATGRVRHWSATSTIFMTPESVAPRARRPAGSGTAMPPALIRTTLPTSSAAT